MIRQQIDQLLASFAVDGITPGAELIETHISWVILSDNFVYKIKKPLCLHFLDFSTMEQRKFYCKREVLLNRRLTEDIYLDVLPVKDQSGRLFLGHHSGKTVDHAVKMRRMEDGRRMDLLLTAGKVTNDDMQKLAEKIAAFHKNTETLLQKDVLDIPDKFADLAAEAGYLQEQPGMVNAAGIGQAIKVSNVFSKRHFKRIAARIEAGFVRDCHGDLHTRNIFLLASPQPFDCIEFNDDLRQIDVLNEVAFLCMDLDALGRHDLSEAFLKNYNYLFPAMRTAEDHQLFLYYKSYRANVRAKINSLRARSAGSDGERAAALAEADKYLGLMNDYVKQLE